MSLIIIMGVACIAIAAAIYLITWPFRIVYALARAVSFNVTGDDENVLVVVPAFIGIMAVTSIALYCLALGLNKGVLDSTKLSVAIPLLLVIYCWASSALMFVSGVATFIIETVGGVFSGVRGR